MRGLPLTSPAWALLKRELTATLRGKGAFVILTLVVSICIVIVMANWPKTGVSFAQMGTQARTIVCLFFFAHLMAATVLPPGLAALAFAEERRLDTLDQLRMSLVTTGGLVGAKLLSAVAVFVLLFVASLPCLGVQLLQVGVSVDEILGLTALTLSTVMLGAGMGILCATVFRRPATALVMSYLGTLFALGGWMLVILLVLFIVSVLIFNGDIDRCIQVLIGFQEFNRISEKVGRPILEGYVHTISAGAVPNTMAWSGTAYRLVIAAGCVLGAALWGRRLTAPAALPSRKLIDAPEVLHARRCRFPFYLIDPLRRKPLIADGDNPILVREWRFSLAGRPRVTVWTFLLTALIVTGLHLFTAITNTENRWTYESEQRAVLVFEVVVMALIVHVVASGTFAREREQMSMDLLRSSLLSPTSIFWGQFCGGAAATLPYLAGATVGFAVSLAVVPFGLGSAPMLAGGFATLLTCAWLTLCITYLATGFVKSTASAIAAGLVANLFVYLWPFLAIAWAETSGQLSNRYAAENFFERLSPVVALCAFRWRNYWNGPGGQIHDLSVEGDLYLTLLVFAAVGLVLMVVGKARFERKVRGGMEFPEQEELV